MSNVFSLDSMREEIEREFSPCSFELPGGKTVVLRNLLRVPRNDREKVYKLLDQLTDSSSDESGFSETERASQIALQVIPLVAEPQELGAKLVELIEDDLALSLRVFSVWMESTQAGEA